VGSIPIELHRTNQNLVNDMNTGPSSPPRIPRSDEAEVARLELRVSKTAMEERRQERRRKVVARMGPVLTNGDAVRITIDRENSMPYRST
jgi:hypothetical protein